MKIRLPRAVLAALTVTALAGATAPALASAAPADPPAGKVTSHTFGKQAEARTYWTPERMKKAKNRTVPQAAKGRAGVRDTTGTPMLVRGSAPSVTRATSATEGAPAARADSTCRKGPPPEEAAGGVIRPDARPGRPGPTGGVREALGR